MARRRIGNASREAERRIVDALQLRLAASAERRIAATIAADYRKAARQIERGEPINVGESTGRVILATWETTAQVFGERMAAQVGKRHGSMERKNLFGDIFRAAFLEFSRRWIATKVTEINSTTEKQIRELVEQGLDDGLGVDAIGKMIRERTIPMSRLRGHVIARTETKFASSWANDTAAQESGLELQKEWASGMDDRVRESHIDADGQRVAMGERFNVGGYLLEYPGDASGPAEEVIMCRCVTLYLEV